MTTKYAHIFKKGKKHVLILSEGFRPVGAEIEFETKQAAKAHAQAVGAKPWNY